MRKMYQTDIKNRLTSVTELTLTRSGVKKNTYMTDYSNTNLIELDNSTNSIITDAISAPITEIANALNGNQDATRSKMIPCNASGAINDFVITTPIIVENAILTVYENYSPGTTASIVLCVGDEEAELEVVEVLQGSEIPINIDINYSASLASSDNPIRLKTVFSNNEQESATSIISFKYYNF